MIVYCATNLINNKKYVGYTTKSLNERIKMHHNKSKNKNNNHYFYVFQSALRKYGLDNFKWDILFETDVLNEVLEMEVKYISELNTLSPSGYNMNKGGLGGIPNDDVKLKISNSLKEYYKTNHPVYIPKEIRQAAAKKSWVTKKNNGYTPKGFNLTEESKFKISETKNTKNKIKWLNVKTNEVVELSLTKMSEYTGLSIGTFNHLKQGRQSQTKCGWKIIK
jgi:group I intron endonuclease